MQLPLKLYRDGNFESGMTEDVSASGVYFHLHPNTQIDSEIEFLLTLPPEVTMSTAVVVKCKATVVRVTASTAKGIGVAAAIDSHEILTSGNA